MVEITVSHDNFSALIGAHPYEKVCVKHKNLKGEIWLEKKYHDIPKPKVVNSTHDIPDIEIIECAHQMDFGETLMRKLRQGYKISSTGCSEGQWRAILIKEVNNNDKD